MITIDGNVYADKFESLMEEMASFQTEGEKICFANKELAFNILERVCKSFRPIKDVVDNYICVCVVING